MNDRRIVTLGSAGVTLIDCVHKTPKAAEVGFPYVAIPQIGNSRINLEEARLISADDFELWTKKAKPKAYDVVLSRRCNPGETAYVPPGVEFALGQNLVLLRADGRTVFPPFLRWLVRSPQWWAQIQKYLNAGAIFDSIKCADVPLFELPIPSLTEQRKIARILSDIDDKIELNYKMNTTLSAMAEAVFKSWFAESSESGSALKSRTAEDDWHIGSLDELCSSITSGGTPTRGNPEFWLNGELPWFKSGELKDGPLLDSSEHITEVALKQSACKLWPVGTILFALYGATVGQMGFLATAAASNQAVAGLIANEKFGARFLLQMLFHVRSEIQNLANGAAQQNINLGILKSQQVVVPPSARAREYSDLMTPLTTRQIEITEEINTLVAMRETLLPKLISGGLEIASIDETLKVAI